MLRIWFKDDPRLKETMWYAALSKKTYGGIKTDEGTGRRMCDVYSEPLDPTADIPDLSEDFIDFVTYRGKVYCGFRTDGIYEADGAILLAKMDLEAVGEGYNNRGVAIQEINAKAPSIDVLKSVLTKFHAGELQPSIDFRKGELNPIQPISLEEL